MQRNMEQKRKSSAPHGGAKTSKSMKRGKRTVVDTRVLSDECWSRPFPVNGQGTLVFNTDRKGLPFFISITDGPGGEPGVYWLALYVGKGCAYFLKHGADDVNGPTELSSAAAGDEVGGWDEVGVEDGKQTYWYSYDRDNLVLKYGKGYRMEETTLLVHDFLEGVKDPESMEKIREELFPYFNAEGQQKYVKQYDEQSNMARYAEGIQVTEPLVEFDKHPLVCNIPPKVMDSSKVTLFDLDRGEFVFSASLPSSCKEMYENVKGCELDYSETPQGEKVKLSDAIRYSIENGILRDKLEEKEKEGELSADPNGTYLRVTLGSSIGKSPGIPYVLEIWPAGHFSPVHNHGNANAVIKVLYGSLTVDIYNKQTGRGKPEPLMAPVEVRKDDVVWINRNWYQTHKLQNYGTEYCATIQCYNYEASDTTYWPYFDFISDDETIDEFFPSSDFGFEEMRNLVMAEYTDYVHGIKRE